MIIYNVTVQTNHTIAQEWLNWLMEEHIPEILQTGCFTDYRVVKLLEVDEADGPTYAIQYFAPSLDKYNIYIDKYATEYRKKSYDKWGNRFVAFHSLMEIVK